MALGKHEHTKHGGFRRERGDSLARNLRQDYPEFNKVDPRTSSKRFASDTTSTSEQGAGEVARFAIV